jgi:hypothetical protein
MKKLLFLSVLIIHSSVLLFNSASAQAPSGFTYQSVLRDANNDLIINTAVGTQISILQTTSTGTAVYVETHAETTNANGLLTLQVGAGSVQSGTFANIDWSAGPYFVKAETDPAGGATYTITGTQQMMSVPYALYAETSGTGGAAGADGPTGPQGPTGADGAVGAAGATGGYPVHTIGESYGGGIVFYVYDGGQHGLIAATADQSSGIRWYGGSYTDTRARGDGIGAGLKNTAIIIANQGPVDGGAFAATVCYEYSVTVGGVTFGDWYLPSKHELDLLYSQRVVVGGFADYLYWSSTENDLGSAWRQIFGNGLQYNASKPNTYYVRAVRAF